MSNNITPEIRFKGFTQDWEQRKLSDIVEILDGDRGKNYPSGKDLSGRGHTLFLSATNVTKNGFLFENNQYISEEKSNLLGNGKINLNDIVLTSRGSIGHIAWYSSHVKEKIPFARVNSGMLILRSKRGIFASYITHYLKSPLGKKQIDLLSFGSAQPQLTKKDISNYKISVSVKDEQKKIGLFFNQLDQTVTLHQYKLEKLKQLKKGYLQVMFPQKGEKVPRLRFAQFTSDWEQRKLGDTAQIKDSARISNEFWVEKGIPYLRSSDLMNNNIKSELFISKDTYEKYSSKTGAPQKDDVLFTSGGKVGVVYHKKDSSLVYVQGGAILYVKTSTSKELEGSFLSTYFNISRMQKYMDNTAVGGTIKHFTLIPANAAPIIFPTIEEQQKIGIFFKQHDDTIALHHDKVKQLKQLKQVYLQKVFV